MLTQLKQLSDGIKSAFDKLGVTSYSHYIRGDNLTFMTQGLTKPEMQPVWPELMMDNSSQVLADMTFAVVMQEWERRGGPFTGEHEYQVNKGTVNIRTERTSYLGKKYIKIILLPKTHFMKKAG